MHANATRVSYTLESTLESVNTAEQAALELAARSGFDEDECGRIGIAVREAMVNAIYHGNQYDPAKHVTVRLESTPESLTIAVRDEGPGLDPATLPDPLAAENFLKSSGRGIFLIRAFMDEVGFPDGLDRHRNHHDEAFAPAGQRLRTGCPGCANGRGQVR